MRKHYLYTVLFCIGFLFLSACTPPNQTPVISQPNTLTFSHNTLAEPEVAKVAFTVRDEEENPAKLKIGIELSNTDVTPLANASCNDTGVCELTLNVQKTVISTATVKLTVSDTPGAKASSSFTITVVPEEKTVASGSELKTLLESAVPGASIKLTNTTAITLDQQILLDKELTLWGLGQDQTILNAQNLDRHFWVKPTGKVILRDLALTNGNATDDGGLIEDDFIGGAIFNEGTLTLEKVLITHSRAVKGGGIYTFTTGITTIIDSIIGSETARNIASRSGGGLFNDGGKLEVIRSQIVFNTGEERGGGIHNLKPSALTLVTDSAVSNNLSLDGAAIKNEEGQLIIRGSTLENNLATEVEGGAIFNSDRLEIYSSVLRNNIAQAGAGGAIYTFRASSSVLLDAVTLENNRAAKSGGGIASDLDPNSLAGSVVLRNGTKIIGNTTGNTGGGIFNAGRLSISEDCQISNNQATNQGGGIFTFGELVAPTESVLEQVVTNNQPDNVFTPPALLGYVARTGQLVLINKSH